MCANAEPPCSDAMISAERVAVQAIVRRVLDLDGGVGELRFGVSDKQLLVFNGKSIYHFTISATVN